MLARQTVCLFVSLAALGTTASASAEVGAAPEPTTQSAALNASWLAFTPPPPTLGVVCLVDSGVDPTPDTTAIVVGSQVSPAALADGGPEGTGDNEAADPANDVDGHPVGHGTEMAMLTAAPANGWGMVGIAPTSVRIFSEKATPAGSTTFPFNDYESAINACDLLKPSDPGMSVISLSLGGQPSVDQVLLTSFDAAVAAAEQRYGMNVVASGGNDGGGLLFPAADPSVLSVGAADTTSHALCTDPPNIFSASWGPGGNLLAPGCNGSIGVDEAFEDDGAAAWGTGSSQATALVSAVLASMRAYAPSLTYAQAQECLISTASGLFVNVASAFTACGLSQIVADGQAAEAAANAAATTTTTTTSTSSAPSGATPSTSDTPSEISAIVCAATGLLCPPSPAAPAAATAAPTTPTEVKASATYPRPRVKVTRRGSHETIRLLNLPAGAYTQVQCFVRRKGKLMLRVTRTTSSVITIATSYAEVKVRFLALARSGRPSVWSVVK